MKNTVLALIMLFLTACASGPKFDTRAVNHTLTVKNAYGSAKSLGQTVLWGGQILAGKNLHSQTRLEILAYPIDKDGFLNQSGEPLGRFYAYQSGYLETAEYSKGRWVSLSGRLQARQSGYVGKATYHFPVVQISQLFLWPESSQQSPSTQFHFGIGISIH